MRTTLGLVFALACLGLAAPARAELVFFASGRSLSIKGHHVDGDSLVLTLRDGGEIVCETSLIARIAPDEVPYPEEVRLKPDATTDSVRLKPDATPVSDFTPQDSRGVRLEPDLYAGAPPYA